MKSPPIFQPLVQPPGRVGVAPKAKGTDILKPALPAALGDRDDVVGRPITLAPAKPGELPLEPGQRFIAFVSHRGSLGFSYKAPMHPRDHLAIDPAYRTDPLIPLEYLVPQVPWIAPEFVLMDALVAAK